MKNHLMVVENNVYYWDYWNDEYTHKYTHEYTRIYDEEHCKIITLNWKASEKEMMAAIYGYIAGYKHGEKIGALKKQSEIKKVLGLN